MNETKSDEQKLSLDKAAELTDDALDGVTGGFDLPIIERGDESKFDPQSWRKRHNKDN